MKTRNLIFLIIAITGLAIITTTCKENNEFSMAKNEIAETDAMLRPQMDNALLSSNPDSAFALILKEVEQNSMVENAWQDEQGAFIKYKGGGLVGWLYEQEFHVPPYMALANNMKSAKSNNDSIVGNKRFGIINVLRYDRQKEDSHKTVEKLADLIADNGFEVDVYENEEANLSVFTDSLSNYGGLFIFGHGGIANNHFWMQTGIETDTHPIIFGFQDVLSSRLFSWNINKLFNNWVDNKVGYFTTVDLINIPPLARTHIYVSEKFIDDSYFSNSFPNSIVYMANCFGYNGITGVLVSKGCQVVFGWTGETSNSPATGYLLFYNLLSGYNAGEAFTMLPDDATISGKATLQYFPPLGKNAKLVEHKNPLEINISNPKNGYSYSNRVVDLSGYVSNINILEKGIVDVNGNADKLNISGRYFSQSIVLSSGANQIKVICSGKTNDGLAASGSKILHVNGDFDPVDLYVKLRWDTDYSDVDIHLLPPGSTVDDLWTSKDCYYYNQNSTWWGGYLDVDDTEGRGPEHITIPSIKSDGEYRLFVHYYDEDGAGTTKAYLNVATKTESENFGPIKLVTDIQYDYYGNTTDLGDIYEVCTIKLPEGTITPVIIKRTLSEGDEKSAIIRSIKK